VDFLLSSLEGHWVLAILKFVGSVLVVLTECPLDTTDVTTIAMVRHALDIAK
jgi:hypothetical protein